MKQYTLEDFAEALVSRLPKTKQREEVLKHLTGECLARATKVHEEKTKAYDVDLDEVLEYLREIADIDGTEYGRDLGLMIELYEGDIGEELQEVLKHEILDNYYHCKEHAKIVEEEVTRTEKYKSIDWV